MIDFSGVSMPFDVETLLSSSMVLIGFVSPFVLLGIAIVFAPKIIGFIRVTILNYQDNQIEKQDKENYKKYRSSYRDAWKTYFRG